MNEPALPGIEPRVIDLDPRTSAFYCSVLNTLSEAEIPILVGGAYAFARYTGIERHTKDFDIFALPGDRDRILETLARHGCATDVVFPHWLAKAYCGEDFIDVIYSSGNGLVEVDDQWFRHAPAEHVLGLPVKLVPAEEMIWSKAFVMERERYDGADIAHILRAVGDRLDWLRLLRRFGPHWRVLLSHLIMFGFIYPSERGKVPTHVMDELTRRLNAETAHPPCAARICAGTFLSRAQYLHDIEQWGYTDPRTDTTCSMTAEDIAIWTAAIEQEPTNG